MRLTEMAGALDRWSQVTKASAATCTDMLIPTRVKADSFQGFQNGASSGVMPIGLRDWANA
jgi:hypothetical protein